MAACKRARRVIVRSGRRYIVCGLRYRPADQAAKAKRHEGAGLVPGATLLAIALFSVFILRWPPATPDNPQNRAPIAAVAHFTIEDFANANR